MGLHRVLDQVAEATVALSFASPGYHLRKTQWDPTDLDVDLSDIVAVVTGANSGLGFSTTEALAKRGARVLMVCRNPERAEPAAADIRTRLTGPGTVEVLICDVAELDQVKDLAETIQGLTPRVDRLVLNAGVLLNQRGHTSAGLEKTFATNVLGGHLLARLLEPQMLAAPAARLLHVTSGGMYTQRLDIDRLQGQGGGYDGVVAYAQTKRAQVILNEMWSARWSDRPAVSHAMHPGWADTPGVEKSLPRFHRLLKPVLRNPEQGADTLVWLAVAEAPGDSSGLLWLDRQPRSTHKMSRTKERAADRQALWSRLEGLCAPYLPDRE